MKETPIFKSSSGRQAILDQYDAILERWPVPFEKLEISTNLGSTFIIACGDPSASPLVLLHGSSTNAAMWIGDVSEYTQRFRVYAVDIPGEPGKSVSIRPELTGSGYADWLIDVLSELKVDHLSMVGISLGGWLALKFAAAFPQRVEKLALLCPSGVGGQKASFMLKALALLPFGRKGRDQLIRIVNGDLELAPEALEFIHLIAENFNPRLEKIPIFPDEELLRLTMPVYLIVGARDALLHSEITADRMGRLLPRITIDLIPNSGHTLIGFQRQIFNFLAGD
jgi:pimeloyl-ACP methyl ester carboxylesterase